VPAARRVGASLGAGQRYPQVHDRDIVRIDAAPAGELIEQADSWRLRHQQRGPDMIVVEQALEIRDVAQIERVPVMREITAP
jgi:hypothetical protein